jgi:exopolysaccharide biosynthesis polyprenyl glycosylphosphotransferase
LIIGADEFAVRVVGCLATAQPSCKVVAFVHLPGQEVTASGAPIYELSDLPMLARSASLHDIVFAAPPRYWQKVPEIMPMFERFSVPVRAILDFGSGVTIGDRVLRLGPMNLLNFGSAPFDTLEYVLLKRVIDLVAALLGTLLLSPFMLMIALLVRITSIGPSLFTQDRVGLNGEVFRIYKFRTMTAAPSTYSDTVWSEPSQRCTSVGSFLRRWSLDELPQLFNVIRGEMSLVGPRPERPHFVLQFHEHLSRYNVRHQLKVGMTGWAQVNGLRGDTSIEERLRYDLFYLQNWSVGFDLRILLLTIAREWLGLKKWPLVDQSIPERRDIHLQRGHSTATRSASRM